MNAANPSRGTRRLLTPETAPGVDESPALSAGSGRVPAAWLKLSPHAQLKPGQVDTLEAIASGGDLVSRQATGSGKSLTFMLPAVAGWQSGFAARQRCRDAQERAELPLPSLVLVLVPFVELMLDLQREADEYFAWLFETGRTPVSRPRGHPLAGRSRLRRQPRHHPPLRRRAGRRHRRTRRRAGRHRRGPALPSGPGRRPPVRQVLEVHCRRPRQVLVVLPSRGPWAALGVVPLVQECERHRSARRRLRGAQARAGRRGAAAAAGARRGHAWRR